MKHGMNKKIAQFLGRKLPFFYGKNKIIRILYSPDRNLHSGEKFVIDYFGKKYEGITSNFIDWGVYFYDGLEKALVNYIKTEISQFQYFFDIGSNSGTISLPFANEKDLRIICFEPLEYNYKKLINNYKLNNAYEKHKFHKIALSNKIGDSYIQFSDVDSNIGSASLNLEFNSNVYNNKEKIILEKLDNLYDFKNKNIFMKIDVEGHEDKLIDGSIKILKNNKVLMYLETVNENLLDNLKKMNFKVLFPIFREGKFKFGNKQNGPDVILKNY
jgi:FkbM family methyltransferase